MEALNSDVLSVEAKATEYKGGIRPAQSYDKISNVAVISVNGAYRDWETDRKSTRLNSSHSAKSRMPSSA